MRYFAMPSCMRFPQTLLVSKSIGFGILIASVFALSSCQSISTKVDAIMEHDDVPQLSREQKEAFTAFKANQFTEAIALFEAAIAMETDNDLKAKLYNGLGSSHSELDQRTQAALAFKESLQINPNNAQVWVNLGIIQRLNGDYEEALKSYEAALLLDPTLATAHSSIGSLRVLQGQPELAISAFKDAIALDETIAVTHGNLALAYAMVSQFEQAQASLEQALSLGYENGDLIQEKISSLKNKS